MADLDLDALERLLAAATPGLAILTEMTGPTTPTSGGPTCGEHVAQEETGEDCVRHICVGVGLTTKMIVVDEDRDANAALIVALLNAAPSLLAEVRRLRAVEAAALPPQVAHDAVGVCRDLAGLLRGASWPSSDIRWYYLQQRADAVARALLPPAALAAKDGAK